MPRPDATEIVQRIGSLDDPAAEELLPLVYDELRKLAGSYLRRNPGSQSIQPTDLVHEAFAALIDRTVTRSRDRARFFAVAARAMRTIIVDHARRRMSQKRGGGWQRVTFTENKAAAQPVEFDLIDLDNALTKLRMQHDRIATVVELRFFGGLTIKEAAETLEVSDSTIKGDWLFAKAWLERELKNPNLLHDE